MSYDAVFSVQEDFRRLMDAFSHPGTVMSFTQTELNEMHPADPLFFRLAMIVLDNEVTFYTNKTHLSLEYIRKMTRSQPVEAKNAQYFFLDSSPLLDMESIMNQANPGSFIDPHTGITVFVRVNRISTDSMYILEGPGIRLSQSLDLGIDNDWLERRIAQPYEFPLGVDFVFYDEAYQLVALPRTTQLRRAK